MKIKRVEIEKEKIYLKKSNFFGWSVVYPYKNEDGTANWFNLLTGGTWAKLILVILIVALILIAIAEYSKNISTLISCFDDPIRLRICIDSFNPNLTLSYVP